MLGSCGEKMGEGTHQSLSSNLTEAQKQRIAENKRRAQDLLSAKRKREDTTLLQSSSSSSSCSHQAESKEHCTGEDYESLTCEHIEEEGTSMCGAVGIDKQLLIGFGEKVCTKCRLYSSQYDLLSRKDMIAEYLIVDDVVRSMKHTTKNNPKNADWTPMKLYLRKHAIAAAMMRFGNEENLQEEKKRRMEAKYERELVQVTSDLFSKEEDNSDDELLSSLGISLSKDKDKATVNTTGRDSTCVAKKSSINSVTLGKKKNGQKKSNNNNKGVKKHIAAMVACIRGE